MEEIMTKWYGSLQNRLMENTVSSEPQIGMGATMTSFSDRHAGTVISWDGKIVGVQRDTVKRIDKNGMGDNQDYEYSPNPDGAIDYYKMNKLGYWVKLWKNPKTGRFNKSSGGLILGVRDEYFDFSF
jgi:hypothetical protein